MNIPHDNEKNIAHMRINRREHTQFFHFTRDLCLRLRRNLVPALSYGSLKLSAKLFSICVYVWIRDVRNLFLGIFGETINYTTFLKFMRSVSPLRVLNGQKLL